jgi:hypothetical protein
MVRQHKVGLRGEGDDGEVVQPVQVPPPPAVGRGVMAKRLRITYTLFVV